MDSSSVRLSPQTLFGLFVVGLALWLTITYASLLVEIAALLFGSFLISLAIRPAANALERWRIPRFVTVLLVYLIILALLGVLGGVVGSTLTQQAQQFIESSPRLVDGIFNWLQSLPLIGPFLLTVQEPEIVLPSLDTLLQSLTQGVQTVGGAVLSTAAGVSKTVIDLTLVLILAFIFTVDKNMGRALLDAWVPARHRARVDAIVSGATARLSRWVLAQLGVILYHAIAFSGGLSIIGVPFAILIGIVGGVLEIVPFLGGVVVLVVSVLAALAVKPILAVWVVVLYAVVTQVGANIVQPTLYGRAVDIHPAAVLVALMIGVGAGGVWGALFAVPSAVVLIVVLNEVRKPLPEPPAPPPQSEEASIAPDSE
jgi:predicted PurR-regulated permease PerM